jgi:hypothetical protein
LLSPAKKLSQTALSSAEHWPIKMSMPALRAVWRKFSDTYWPPCRCGASGRVAAALPERHLQGFDDELGAHVIGHRPVDAAPRKPRRRDKSLPSHVAIWHRGGRVNMPS